MAKNRQDIICLDHIKPTEIFQKLDETCDYFLAKKSKLAWHYLLSKDHFNALSESQTVLDRVWEHLNTGYWKDVKFVWRQLYSFASLIKSLAFYHIWKNEESLKACDMGLLMGAPIFNNALSTLATKLSFLCRSDRKSECQDSDGLIEPPEKKKFVNDIGNSMIDQYLIKRIEPPSLVGFQNDYVITETPVIIKNLMTHWPAYTTNKWSIDYLKNMAGSRTVPVEIGDKYTSENWTQKLMTINEFIDSFIATRSSTGYLAQHQLFEQIPELKKDIIIPDYCFASCKENTESSVLTHAWFGPVGTVSPLHHDPYHNLFAQVMGSKYIRLYNRDSKYMYPNKDTILDNTSQVDLEYVNEDKFPRFFDNDYYECVLNAGEMLYVPYKWWHFVKSLATSFSVSFWWK